MAARLGTVEACIPREADADEHCEFIDTDMVEMQTVLVEMTQLLVRSWTEGSGKTFRPLALQAARPTWVCGAY
jgi:hypothetical protein